MGSGVGRVVRTVHGGVCAGRDAAQFFENARKIEGVVKADGGGDLPDGAVGRLHQRAGARDAKLQQELLGRHAVARQKAAIKARMADRRVFGKLRHRDGLIIMGGYVIDRQAHAVIFSGQGRGSVSLRSIVSNSLCVGTNFGYRHGNTTFRVGMIYTLYRKHGDLPIGNLKGDQWLMGMV